MKTNRRFLLAAIFGLALVFTFSCSGGGSGEGGIVNANNEAWVDVQCNECKGLIFKQNGEFISIKRENGGNWCIYRTSTYSIRGNQITFSYTDDMLSYSISGNTLTVIQGSKSSTLTRMSVNISGDCSDKKD